jgi:hypothetical protein
MRPPLLTSIYRLTDSARFDTVNISSTIESELE